MKNKFEECKIEIYKYKISKISMKHRHIHDIVIIGGGIAGLYASLQCCKAGLSVATFEKDSRWGGRIRTIYNGNDHYEAGAARFHESHQHLLRLLKRYHIDIVPIDNRPREYRSRAGKCPSKPVQSPAYSLISKIIEESKKYKPDMLRSMTFGQFAERVLGATQKLLAQSSFGYDGEFNVINAYDGVAMFKNDFDKDEVYYICKNGMSTLVESIVKELEVEYGNNKWKGYLEHRISKISRKNGIFTITATRIDGTKIYKKARIIIGALPKQGLLELHTWNTEQIECIQSVDAVPCERIYAKYTTPWYAGTHITTTDLPIRQFIPITDHIAMVSYSDSKQADEWNNIALQGTEQLTTRLHNELKELFPEKKVPTQPQWIDTYYHNDAIHMWKTGINSIKMRKHIQTKLWGEDAPFFVCGEAYSTHQCWVNGALESVEQIMPMVHKSLKKVEGGNDNPASTSVPSSWLDWVKQHKKGNDTLTKQKLAELKKLYPEAKWVLFKDRLINLNEWYYSHPGGQTPFDNHMHTDVYPFFTKISHHYDMEKKEVKEDVMKKIEQLTIARIR